MIQINVVPISALYSLKILTYLVQDGECNMSMGDPVNLPNQT